MINRVIYGGKVYYKVADLAELFDVSLYKMRKIVKAQNIGENLQGFGRAVFVMEENVAKIEVRNEVKILETKFTVDPVKKVKTVKTPVIDVKKPTKKSAKKNVDNVVELRGKSKNEIVTIANDILTLQNEHTQLLDKGKKLSQKIGLAGKLSLTNDIVDKHLGSGEDLFKAPVDKIEQIRLIIAELEIAVTELNESSGEVAVALNVDTPNDEPELSF
ncbi:hypothetical protein [Neobacillus niacini]|uniref:hypothetical protein n=1 Tax=Neobacillus niacini TaxID=86668 RepID=UPI0005EF9135|nr:hypothetical protein [Neobacillus niacini]